MKADTRDLTYTNRLATKEAVWWKRLLDVQRPYRWNLQRLPLGDVLEVGCGIGRNLKNLGGRGVGIDHNSDSVKLAKERGFSAYTPEEFDNWISTAGASKKFDSLLLAHVVEHMNSQDAVRLINQYLPYIKDGGHVLLITPQEAGYASDPTHVAFADFKVLEEINRSLGLRIVSSFSFPFPRFAGKFFTYNEFNCLSQK